MDFFNLLDHNTIIPLRLMISGYRSLVGRVVDIAYRMAILNPDLREDVVHKTPGMIMIDKAGLTFTS